uniref:G_PROTEIN_RECEP_F1_2 domain-containing protein n=1 Tax=Panagrellus redivivus TaxID=6233 RepID=A0A7E4W5V3_PANRE
MQDYEDYDGGLSGRGELVPTPYYPTTTTEEQPTPRSPDQVRDDLIVVTVWSIMLTYALISNILIVYGILKSKPMRSSTSYWFIISLAVCDLVMIIISFIHLVPATAFHSAFVKHHSTRNIIMIFIYDFFWYTGVLQLGLMAGNRFVSIVYPMEYKWMFSPQRSIYILIVMYFLGFLSSLPTLFECCHTLWLSTMYITVYANSGTWYKYVDMGVNSLSLVVMVFSYAVIIYKVRESGKAMAKYQLTIRTRVGNQKLLFQQQAQQMNGSDGCSRVSSLRPPRSQVSKKEMRLFIQFFVVSLVFLLTWTTWQWLPTIYASKWAYFVMTSLFFINNSVNPTVYLLFNTQLRRELHYLLCRSHAIAAAQHRRKRTLLNRHATDTKYGEATELQNGVGASSTASNANDVSQSSNSSSNEFAFFNGTRRSLITNDTATSKKPKKGVKAQVTMHDGISLTTTHTDDHRTAQCTTTATTLTCNNGGSGDFSVL